METAPDYELAIDCLTSLYDATAKLTSTAARGKQYSKSDLMEVTGLVHMTLHLAKAAHVDLDGAFDASIDGGEPDSRRADRALLVMNESTLKSIKYLMGSRSKTTSDARRVLLDEAFDRFQVRHLYAVAMTFAAATGVKVEG